MLCCDRPEPKYLVHHHPLSGYTQWKARGEKLLHGHKQRTAGELVSGSGETTEATWHHGIQWWQAFPSDFHAGTFLLLSVKCDFCPSL